MRLNGRTEVSKCLSSLLPESLKGMDWGGGSVGWGCGELRREGERPERVHLGFFCDSFLLAQGQQEGLTKGSS